MVKRGIPRAEIPRLPISHAKWKLKLRSRDETVHKARKVT